MTPTRPSNAPADPDEKVPEYLARYAPRKLNRDQWERFRDDFVGLIEAAKPPKPRAAAVLCSVLADFLRFCLASHPSIEVAAALTDLHVGRYIAGLTCGEGTRQMRKTNLMLLVNTVHSLPRVRKTRRTPRFASLTPDELLSMVPVLRGAPDGIRARIWHDVASGIATGSVGHEADHRTITLHADLVYVTSPTGQTSPLGPWQVALIRLAHELEIADDVTIAGHKESAHWLKAAGIDLGPTPGARASPTGRAQLRANSSGARGCPVVHWTSLRWLTDFRRGTRPWSCSEARASRMPRGRPQARFGAIRAAARIPAEAPGVPTCHQQSPRRCPSPTLARCVTRSPAVRRPSPIPYPTRTRPTWQHSSPLLLRHALKPIK